MDRTSRYDQHSVGVRQALPVGIVQRRLFCVCMG